ncbi:NAD(+) ADP-ribosyltransferase protein [Dioscorea alata]|uniref:NAD(+) ADP-ribosyltransferase protein n=1 Tax=Dioscorea alata TaxID=55571 RepID=A0ACB7UW47_DIOAL|nr:NAD(+) ADP-ribosyltransferase protein [Dioscorea alata]
MELPPSSPELITSFCCFSHSPRAQLRDFNNFKNSARPSRILFFSNDSWIDFARKVFDDLCAAFVAEKPAVDVTVDGKSCLVNFLSMSLIEMDTGTLKSIAWIDCNGRCFFPRVLPERMHASQRKKRPLCDDHCWKAKKKEKIMESSDFDERSDESPDVCSVIASPEKQSWPDLLSLSEGSASYKHVEDLFLAGVRPLDSDIVVTGVRKCTHASRSAKCRKNTFDMNVQSTKSLRGDSNVKLGWYGASPKEVAGIIAHGFGQPNYKSFGHGAHGVGVHLSPPNFGFASSLLSTPDENGEKHIILCQVLMGNSEQIPAGSYQFHPSNDLFDTAVDDLKSPRWFIVWTTHMNTHILPLYVVTFKSSNQIHGSCRMVNVAEKPSFTNVPFPKLFAEVAKSLPEFQVRALEMQFHRHKEGKMSKEAFIRCLRTLAGDKLLSTSLQRIRGHC